MSEINAVVMNSQSRETPGTRAILADGLVAANNVKIRVELGAAPGIRPLLRGVLLQELPKHYDEVDSSFVESLIASASSETDRYGYFTRSKQIFVAWDGETPVAFTIATRKRGGSVKIGPTGVSSTFRRCGVATLLRDVAEGYLRDDATVRKIYMTVSETNLPALAFNIQRGFQVEGVLSSQYREGGRELVLGRFLESSSEPLRTPPTFANHRKSTTGVKASVHLDPDPQSLECFLAPRMDSLYSDVDPSYFRSIADACAEERQSYQKKGKTLLIAGTYHEPVGMGVYVPKRGGAAKISPFFGDDEAAIIALIEAAQTLGHSNDRHKIYVHTPTSLQHQINALLGAGYTPEAQLRSAYAAEVDVLVMGRSLRDEP